MSNNRLFTESKLTPAKIFQLTALSTALALTACGGDKNGNGGGVDYFPVVPDGSSASDNNDDSQAQIVGDYKVYLSTSSDKTIKMEKGEEITITARVLDLQTYGVVANQEIKFVIPDPQLTGIFSNASPTLLTNDKGEASITLTIAETLTDKQKDLLVNGIKLIASINDKTTDITIYGVFDDSTPVVIDPEALPDYNVLFTKSANQMRTGTDSLDVTIRVTDKNGGIVAGVPLYFNIVQANQLGLTLDGKSNAVTDNNGLIKIKLLQLNTGINSQLSHLAKLEVRTNKDDEEPLNSLMLEVGGSKIDNITTSQSSLLPNEVIHISGDLSDGSNSPINTSKYGGVKLLLINEGKQVGEAQSDINGKFSFDNIEQTELTATDDKYNFDIKVVGASNGQTEEFNNAASVIALTSKDIEIEVKEKLQVASKTSVTIKAPGKNGEKVFISTTKGEFGNGKTADTAVISNGEATFTFSSIVPGAASITAQMENEPEIFDVAKVVVSSTTPGKLLLQSISNSVATNASTDIVAVVLDKNDTPIANAQIAFSIVRDGSGGQLSQSLATTNEYGKAIVTYIAGDNPTANNAVEIRANIYGVDTGNGFVQPNITFEQSTKLTVTTQSSSIAIGLADKLINGDREVYYYRNGSAFVTNNAGQPASNQEITLTLRPKYYYKGYKVSHHEIEAFNHDEYAGPQWLKVHNKNTGERAAGAYKCKHEDANYNSILDPGEDINGNGQIDFGYRATILVEGKEVVADNGKYNLVTDSSGNIDFKIRYLKSDAQWMEMDLIANTKVDGSESTQQQLVGFSYLADDETPESTPNDTSPFGIIGDCTSAQ